MRSFRVDGKRLLPNRSAIWLALPFCLFLLTQPGLAQDTETDGEDAPIQTFDDVVTVAATKQGEVKVQELPIAITAFDVDRLDRLDVVEFDELVVQSPGTNFIENGGPGRGHSLISMRGLSPVADNTVSVVGQYLDGAPRFGANYRLFDIGEVAILRGPQGTLWGSQAVGGLISFASRAPQLGGMHARLATEYSSTSGGADGFLVNGFLNLPLNAERVALRLAAQHVGDGGYVDNPTTGQEDVNDSEETALRASLLFQASDSAALRVIHHRADLSADYPSFFEPSLPGRQRTIPLFDLPADQEFSLTNVIYDQVFGWGALTYNGSYYALDRRFESGTESAFGFVPLTKTAEDADDDSMTHELRLASTGGSSVRWVGGLFWDENDTNQTFVQREVSNPVTPGPLAVGDGVSVFTLGGPEKISEKAIFGEVTFSLGSGWELLLGGRYFDWEVENDQDTQFLSTSFGQETGTVGDEDSFYKLHLSKAVGDNDLLYFMRSEGFRVGGFNPFVGEAWNSSLEFLKFDPDRLVNYELGYKSTWLRNKLALNLAVYRMDWEDVQAVVRDSIGQFAFTANASDLEADGAELELFTQDLLGKGVFAGLSYTYSDNEFQQDAVIFPEAGRVLIEKGDKLQRTPKNAWSADFGYNFQLGEDWLGYFRANYWHKDETSTEGFNSGFGAVPIPAQNVINVSVGAYFGPWELRLGVDNVDDSTPLLSVGAGGPTLTEAVVASSIRPRTVSFRVGYDW